MKRLLFAALALAALPFAAFGQANLPINVTFQGKVSDATGALIGAGTPVSRKVRFRIYDSPTSTLAANRLHTEEQTVVIANGEFNILLGAGTAVSGETLAALDTVFTSLTGGPRYLGITVDGGSGTFVNDPEISPRQQIVTVPYAFRAKVATSVLDGNISTAMIGAGAVTNAKLAADAVSTTQVANLAISTAKIADLAITTAKLADLNVTTAKLADASITTAKLAANVVDTTKILDGTIGTADLADNAITSIKILDGTIANADLAANAVTSAKILDGTIATADLADSVITSVKIADGAVTTADLSDLAITPAKLAPEVGGINGAYNYLRVNGGNSQGFLFGAFSSLSDGVHLTYNNFSNGATGAWSIPAPAGGQSRLSLGYGSITLATVAPGGVAGGISRMEVHADGRIGFAGANGDPNSQVVINNTSGRVYPFAIATSAGGWFYFEHNGNAYKSTGGSWSSSSDARLKKDVASLNGSLEQLLRLRSVTFRFKDEARYAPGAQTGFIAQEVEQVFPSWVSDGPDGFKAITIKGFEALTVQAFRELRAEKDAAIAERDRTIAALEQRLREFEAQTTSRLASLEKRLTALSAAASQE